jgi:aminomethyltransferase
MARIRSYGHVNRRLIGLLLDGKEPASPGDAVRRGAKDVGSVTSSVRSPNLGRPIALAMIRREAAAPGTAVEVDRGGSRTAAVVAELPFVRS